MAHFLRPLVGKRVDFNDFCVGTLSYNANVSVGKLFLHEEHSGLSLACCFDELLQLQGAGLASFFFDGELLQAIFVGKIGE